jgi:hypothetical protein
MARLIVTLAVAGCLGGAVGVTGCTSNSTTPASGGTSQTVAEQLAHAFCAWQACCGGAATADGGQISDAGATCVAGGDGSSDAGEAGGCFARAELAAEQQLSLLATAYGEGLVTINVAVTKACASAYQARTCGGTLDLNVDEALADTACAGLFTGNIPVGYRCDMTAECVSSAYCLSQSSGRPITSIMGGGTLGVCFPYQTAGQTCNSTADCLPPLTCAPTTFTCG